MFRFWLDYVSISSKILSLFAPGLLTTLTLCLWLNLFSLMPFNNESLKIVTLFLSSVSELFFDECLSLCKFQRTCFIWGSWKFRRLPRFRFWPLYWNWKLGKLGNIFKTCKFQRTCFIWRSRKFPRFPSFWFWPLYWNWKLGKLGNILKTCKFQRTFLFEEVGNFRGFQVFDFDPYTEIENSENSETLC